MAVNVEAAIEFIERQVEIRAAAGAHQAAMACSDVASGLRAALSPQPPEVKDDGGEDHGREIEEWAKVPDVGGPYSVEEIGTFDTGHQKVRNTWEAWSHVGTICRRSGARAERQCRALAALLNQAYKNGQLSGSKVIINDLRAQNDALHAQVAEMDKIVRAAEKWYDTPLGQTPGLIACLDELTRSIKAKRAAQATKIEAKVSPEQARAFIRDFKPIADTPAGVDNGNTLREGADSVAEVQGDRGTTGSAAARNVEGPAAFRSPPPPSAPPPANVRINEATQTPSPQQPESDARADRWLGAVAAAPDRHTWLKMPGGGLSLENVIYEWTRLNLQNEAMTKEIEALRAQVGAMEPVVMAADREVGGSDPNVFCYTVAYNKMIEAVHAYRATKGTANGTPAPAPAEGRP